MNFTECGDTLTNFWLNCFKIMASKSGFFWKIWNCGYLYWQKHFFDGHTYKTDIGRHFDKKKSARAAPLSKNSWNIFQMQITPLLRRSQDPQGCLKKPNHPLSLNLAVWCAKIGFKAKNLWKIVEKPSYFDVFFCHFDDFSKILGFRPNFSAQNHQIRTQWMISLLQTPLGSLGVSK